MELVLNRLLENKAQFKSTFSRKFGLGRSFCTSGVIISTASDKHSQALEKTLFSKKNSLIQQSLLSPCYVSGMMLAPVIIVVTQTSQVPALKELVF